MDTHFSSQILRLRDHGKGLWTYIASHASKYHLWWNTLNYRYAMAHIANCRKQINKNCHMPRSRDIVIWWYCDRATKWYCDKSGKAIERLCNNVILWVCNIAIKQCHDSAMSLFCDVVICNIVKQIAKSLHHRSCELVVPKNSFHKPRPGYAL